MHVYEVNCVAMQQNLERKKERKKIFVCTQTLSGQDLVCVVIIMITNLLNNSDDIRTERYF